MRKVITCVIYLTDFIHEFPSNNLYIPLIFEVHFPVSVPATNFRLCSRNKDLGIWHCFTMRSRSLSVVTGIAPHKQHTMSSSFLMYLTHSHKYLHMSQYRKVCHQDGEMHSIKFILWCRRIVEKTCENTCSDYFQLNV